MKHIGNESNIFKYHEFNGSVIVYHYFRPERLGYVTYITNNSLADGEILNYDTLYR